MFRLVGAVCFGCRVTFGRAKMHAGNTKCLVAALDISISFAFRMARDFF